MPNHSSDFDEANLYAAFCVAFSGFLRLGEFTYSATKMAAYDFKRWHITTTSVQISQDVASLTLEALKTDQFRTSVTIYPPATDDEACPRAALLNLMKFQQLNAPLLQRLQSRPFTQEYVIDTLHSLL
jgi:hypothetical protein